MNNYDFQETIEATEVQTIMFENLIKDSRKKGFIDIGGFDKNAWLILRTFAGLGASDIATALGFVPSYFDRSPLKVWKEKIGHIVEVVDKPILRIGRNVEEAIVQEYEYLTGRKVMRVKDKMFLHPEHDFLFADLDGIIQPAGGEGYGVLECKSTLSYVYEDWKEKLPTYYFRQVMAELSVMSDLSYFKGLFNSEKYKACDYADVAILILDKREVQILRFNRDEEFITNQNTELLTWWNEHIIANVPPPETAAEWAKTDPSEGSFIEATQECYKNYQELLRVQKEKKNLETEETELKDKLIEEIQDNEALVYSGEIICTYKQQSKTDVDGKKLKAEKPDIWNEYKKTSTVRVLRPKTIKIFEY